MYVAGSLALFVIIMLTSRTFSTGSGESMSQVLGLKARAYFLFFFDEFLDFFLKFLDVFKVVFDYL